MKGSGSSFDKRACAKNAKEFFVRGRNVTLPDGDLGVFIEWVGTFQAKVFRGTIAESRSGVSLVMKNALLDVNQDKYYNPKEYQK